MKKENETFDLKSCPSPFNQELCALLDQHTPEQNRLTVPKGNPLMIVNTVLYITYAIKKEYGEITKIGNSPHSLP